MPAPPGLAPFPDPDPGDVVHTPATLSARRLALRHARTNDFDFLCTLYATTRAQEMAPVPWPEPAKRQFLADQFALQHRHYLAHYPDARFLVLDGPIGPVGRYYLQRGVPDFLLVDISLLPHWRGQGIGAALVADSQAQAARGGRGMALHVRADNPGARRLYERLGFTGAAVQDTYQRMHWTPRDAGHAAGAVS